DTQFRRRPFHREQNHGDRNGKTAAGMSFHARTLTLPSLRRRAHPLPQIPERGPDSPLPDWDRCKTSSPSRLATLAPLDEEVLGGLILRCEGEARASPRPHPEVRGRSPSLEGRGRLLRNDPGLGEGGEREESRV